MRVKICNDLSCKYAYNNIARTKWHLDFKYCPYCGSKLHRYETGSITIKIR